MKYVIVPVQELTTRQIIKSNAGTVDGLRKSADGSKCVIKIDDRNAQYFENYQSYTLEEIRAEMAKSEWTGVAWYDGILNFFTGE